jgi:hypothetical protein
VTSGVQAIPHVTGVQLLLPTNSSASGSRLGQVTITAPIEIREGECRVHRTRPRMRQD